MLSFFFNDSSTTEIYTLSLTTLFRSVHHVPGRKSDVLDCQWLQYLHSVGLLKASFRPEQAVCEIRSLMRHREDRKSTRLNSSHSQISYAVFCLKKKKKLLA